MITILHGEDIIKSRLQLNLIKKEYKEAEILILDGKKINLTDLLQALESNSLITKEKLIILENLSQNKKLIEILDYLKINQPSADLVIWESKELTKTYLKIFHQAEVFIFKPEATLFKFLDSIKPKNSQEILSLLQRCIRLEEPEIIFYMLTRRLRMLLLFRDGVTEGMDEIDHLVPWQKGKLMVQAKLFFLDHLLDLYRQLLEIDYQQKTGHNNFNLKKSLELFLINI